MALAANACAVATPCSPTSVVVERKEERARVEFRRGPVRVTPSGRVEETTEPVRVVEYWIHDTAGGGHRVDAAAFGAATPGRPIEVCP